MRFGLTEDTIEAINAVFADTPGLEKVILYGSRAMGNHRPGSDIDLTLEGDELTLSDLLEIEQKLDDLLLPYKMDLSLRQQIENQDLLEHIERVGKAFWEPWIECTLGEIVTFQRGFDITKKEQVSGNFPVISSSGVKSYHNEYKVNGPGVIIGRKGTLGTVFYVEGKYWPHDTSLWVKDFKGNYPKFIYYFLKGFRFERFNVGSSNPTLNRNHIHLLPAFLPPLPEQRAIASVLSSLDDKMDLLHRQNETLEAIAETLFRQWFVEEAEEEWEEVPLNILTDIGIGRTPPRKESQWFSTSPSDVKWISIKDMGNDGAYIFTTSEYLTEKAVQIFRIPLIPQDTVVLSFKMTVGRVAITTESMLSNEAIAHFKFHSETPFTKEYLFLFLKTYRYETLGSTSSIVTSINSRMIKDLLIPVPNKIIMSRFQAVTEPVFDKIKFNQEQILNISQLRDTLLPKLMSGEVRLKITD